ncbi:unnamed protein product [Acanthoscelides obtectus]|uniref:Uncharacterized protein n=1 Tax=Acanthoscelides obtectus TaxID=200917 RepID=A0A9P0JQF4_ACAOB|nr:unnamed protein product [Acanthoscelides obtectus]CAK1661865.1 hypothetical protein AOBTE_LOCUS22841 [Acanthoscelides obtectus]
MDSSRSKRRFERRFFAF